MVLLVGLSEVIKSGNQYRRCRSLDFNMTCGNVPADSFDLKYGGLKRSADLFLERRKTNIFHSVSWFDRKHLNWKLQ